MEYQHGSPITKNKHVRRRQHEQRLQNLHAERNRQHARGGGQANESGILQGQNAEQGNTVVPEQTQGIGRSEH